MGVRVGPEDLPNHLLIQHQHNLNRGAEAEAQYAPIAARASMIAEPVRMLGYFGGPVGAGYAETKAQQIEQAGGARQGYDPMAIGGQMGVPIVANVIGKGLSKLASRRTTAPQIAPVPTPTPSTGVAVKGSYFGPERRQFDPAVMEEYRKRAVQGGLEKWERRKTIGEAAMTGEDVPLSQYMRYQGDTEGSVRFNENFERTRRGGP
jgi:hypothetical protein